MQTDHKFIDQLRRAVDATAMSSHEIDEGIRTRLRDLCRLAACNGFGAIRVSQSLIHDLVLIRRKAKWDSDFGRSYLEAIDELHDKYSLSIDSGGGNETHVIRWCQGDVFPLLSSESLREALGIDQWRDHTTGMCFRHVPVRKEELT